MKPSDPRNEVCTVVVMNGAADSRISVEAFRKSFDDARIAARVARRHVTVAGGHHAAYVFFGRPTNPIAEFAALFNSAARKRFLAAAGGSQ